MPDQHADQGDDRQRVGTALLHGEPEVAAGASAPARAGAARRPATSRRRSWPCPRPRPRTRWRRRRAVSAGRPGGGSRRSRRSGTAAARRINRTAPSGRSPGSQLQALRLRQLGTTCIRKLGRSESQSPRAAASTPQPASRPGGAQGRADLGQPRRPLLDHPVPGQPQHQLRTLVDDRRHRCRPCPAVRAGSEPAAIAPTIRAGACLRDPPLVTPAKRKTLHWPRIPQRPVRVVPPSGVVPQRSACHATAHVDGLCRCCCWKPAPPGRWKRAARCRASPPSWPSGWWPS